MSDPEPLRAPVSVGSLELYSGAYRGGECWAFVIECQPFNRMATNEAGAAKHRDQAPLLQQ